MQTFLPYRDFDASAKCLDRMRLGKQRVEVVQLLNALEDPDGVGGWRNHPAARMWRGYQRALCLYGVAICCEWIARGYKDNCATRIIGHMQRLRLADESPAIMMPPWFGDERLHASHRSNLLRKMSAHYGAIRPRWTESPDLPYWWPA